MVRPCLKKTYPCFSSLFGWSKGCESDPRKVKAAHSELHQQRAAKAYTKGINIGKILFQNPVKTPK
jgi:hypothetical protein